MHMLAELSTVRCVVCLHFDSANVSAVVALERFISLKDIQHLVVTHLTPKHVTSIKTFLNKRNTGGDVSQLQITLSNPARQVLMSTMGMASCPTEHVHPHYAWSASTAEFANCKIDPGKASSCSM